MAILIHQLNYLWGKSHKIQLRIRNVGWKNEAVQKCKRDLFISFEKLPAFVTKRTHYLS